MIDTSLFDESELTSTREVAAGGGATGAPLVTYPVAIRMECLGPGMAKEGCSLEVRLTFECLTLICSIVHSVVVVDMRNYVLILVIKT